MINPERVALELAIIELNEELELIELKMRERNDLQTARQATDVAERREALLRIYFNRKVSA